VILHTPDDSPETAWGLTPVSLRVVRAAKRARSIGELVDLSGGAEKDSVWQAVDFLLQLGIVCFGDTVMQAQASAEAMPDGVFSDIVIEQVAAKPLDPRVAEYRAQAAEFDGTPPWELFGITDPAEASVAFVDKAFLQLSVTWHPDRFADEGEEVVAAAATCFAALGYARDLFDEEDFRKEVRDRLIAKREGRVYVTESDAKKARMAYTQGEHAARRKDWAVALPLLEESLTLDPRSWEATLQLALARWRSGATSPAEAAVQLAEIHPPSAVGRAEARYQLGEAHLAVGSEQAAYKAFHEAVEVKPDHVGSNRRIRMRARRLEKGDQKPGSSKSGGLRGMFSWGRNKS
jgi:predicted negative regulator of RcsB-dependent stress response